MFELASPDEVIEILTDIFSEEVVVLEYGSGGSTFLALTANHKNIIY